MPAVLLVHAYSRGTDGVEGERKNEDFFRFLVDQSENGSAPVVWHQQRAALTVYALYYAAN